VLFFDLIHNISKRVLIRLLLQFNLVLLQSVVVVLTPPRDFRIASHF
jgi:hypothetical protein